MSDDAMVRLTSKEAHDELRGLALEYVSGERGSESEVPSVDSPRSAREEIAELLDAAPSSRPVEGESAEAAAWDRELMERSIDRVVRGPEAGRRRLARLEGQFAEEPRVTPVGSGAPEGAASSSPELVERFQAAYAAIEDPEERKRVFDAVIDAAVDIDVETPSYSFDEFVSHEHGVEEAVVVEDDDEEWVDADGEAGEWSDEGEGAA